MWDILVFNCFVQDCLKRGRVETARAIYAHALAAFPGKKSIWRVAAQLEKAHGSREALDALLRKAVAYCPQARLPFPLCISYIAILADPKLLARSLFGTSSPACAECLC